eukprot:Partr_v1_DN28669_c0_g1_i3_m50117 putative tRNA-histidine guanylyltransferase 1-like (S. cerevisiae)
MNAAARHVLESLQDIMLAYGQSDEYSFVLKKDSTLYQRRASKLTTAIVSLFSSAFVFKWRDFFSDEDKLKYPPSFDGRAVCYPSEKNLRDYMAWRQADCHINNMYNTCFWNLVDAFSKVEDVSASPELRAERALSGTLSGDKNEILFQQFGINYNNLPAIYRKGSILTRDQVTEQEVGSTTGKPVQRTRKRIVLKHVDMITDDAFWVALLT